MLQKFPAKASNSSVLDKGDNIVFSMLMSAVNNLFQTYNELEYSKAFDSKVDYHIIQETAFRIMMPTNMSRNNHI